MLFVVVVSDEVQQLFTRAELSRVYDYERCKLGQKREAPNNGEV